MSSIRTSSIRHRAQASVLMLIVSVCSGLAEAQSSRAPAVAPGTMVGREPREVSQRPVDLAIFTGEEIRQRISVSSDLYPNGRGDMPWLIGVAPKYFSSMEFSLTQRGQAPFRASDAPYWAATNPASVHVDLGRECYVSALVVRPLEGRNAGLEFEMFAVQDDGELLSWSPPASARVNSPEAINRNQRGIPTVISVHPKRVRRVRIDFAQPPDGERDIYIREMRILGYPVDSPNYRLRTANDEERAALEEGSGDLARFSQEDAKRRVRVSDDRRPSGSFIKPWLDAESKRAADPTGKDYWSAGAPAWAEVTLPNPSFIHRILVQPLGERLGVGGFYAKVVTDDGVELDLNPPAEIERPTDPEKLRSRKPLPLVVDFEPVLAQRIKLYFTQPSIPSELMFIEDIRIFGIEADPE